MKLIVKDENGNSYTPLEYSTLERRVYDVSAKLSDNGEAIVVTVRLTEASEISRRLRDAEGSA